MALFRKFAHGVRALCWKKRIGDELEEELHSFIEAAVEQKILSGMTREEALRAARVEVGSVAAPPPAATEPTCSRFIPMCPAPSWIGLWPR